MGAKTGEHGRFSHQVVRRALPTPTETNERRDTEPTETISFTPPPVMSRKDVEADVSF